MIHSLADVEDGALIGSGTKIWRFTHVRSGAKIGQHCNIGQGCFVDQGAVVGDGVKIQNNVSVYKGVTLEDGVFVGPSAVFTNDLTPRAPFPKDPKEYPKTIVQQGATIGANSTIVCGVTIGQWAFVGAGAVVTKDVEPHALVVGTPARRVDYVCKCGHKISDREGACGSLEYPCTVCDRIYTVNYPGNPGVRLVEAPS